MFSDLIIYNFDRSTDYDLIREIMTHPKMWSWISDDFAGAPDQFQPARHPELLYVLVRDGEELLGMFLLVPHSPIMIEVHTCLLPNAWGLRASSAARDLPKWLALNTRCKRLITQIPDYNRLAVRFAESAGMEEYGRNLKAYMKNGELRDLVLMGMPIGEVN